MKNQTGQVILILILVMTVALAIGISVIQRSLSDISTSSKVEQSSRAFSAAEAGIEKALRNDFSSVGFTDASATVTGSGLLPLAGQALEYPPLGKEEVAQVWLADPRANLPLGDDCGSGYTCYDPSPPRTLDVYWGNSTTDKAALELTLISYSGGYATRKWYLDHNIARSPDNRFTRIDCTGYPLASNNYQCKFTIGGSSDPDGVLPAGRLILIRVRLLYNSTSQPIAVAPKSGSSLPPQARIIESTGTAGGTQRKIQLFQLYKVVPPYFDYGIFSVGEINKN